MNLLTKDRRDYLPSDKRKLIEVKEKRYKYGSKIKLFLAFFFVIIVALVLFPQSASKILNYSTPVYGETKSDNNKYITNGNLTVKRISKTEAEALLVNSSIPTNNKVDDTSIQYGQLAIRPNVDVKSISIADNRVKRLYDYLSNRKSPMAGSANTFIQVADKYGIDWRLLPAIAGNESGFGKVIPLNKDGSLSYNAFGFGVYGGNYIKFNSWDEAIGVVAKGIVATFGKENLKPELMEKVYTPPSYYGNHSWRDHVKQFMSEF